MATRFTNALAKQFQALNEDPAIFAAEFDRWKRAGAAGEYDSYLFGKDGAYAAPAVGGQPNILRHVHLAPLGAMALLEWNRQWKRGSRKVSDRALVYASSPRHGHLLIFILHEPTAHTVARMATPAHRTLMLKFCKIADRFLFDGSVIG